MSGGFRASSTIPNNVKKTIQNIKEITGNHSDDEIYAMLKECSMDPNETTQKLLLQDNFHEVKRRKDRKKENQTSRDVVDSRWRPGPPGRGDRGGRGNYTSRYGAQDAGGGRSSSAKENGSSQASNKAGSISSPPVQETKRKEDGSSVTEMSNGPVNVASGGTKGANTLSSTKELEPQTRSGGSKRSNMVSGVIVESIMPTTFSGVVSNDTHVPAVVGTVKRDVGSQHSHVEPNSSTSPENKSNAGKMGGKSQAGKNHSAEFSQSSSLSHGSSSRPSSNYGSRSQQALGSQKVAPNKEWKPKATNTNTVQGLNVPAAPEGSNILTESLADTQSVENITDSACVTNKLEKEPEGLHVKDAQHVIIPNHIHVPDAVRTGLSFGSFDATYVIASKCSSESETENLKSVSETEQGIEETLEEEVTSQSTMTPREEVDYVDSSQSPKPEENLSSGDVNVPANSVPDFGDSTEIVSGPQDSNIHTSAGYNFGLLPPMLGNPLGSLEASETQARDASRASSFVVQQPVDPSSFYAQFYRSGADSDGRVSPFPAHVAAAKYSGNVAVLPSQSPTEGGNSVVLSTAAQTPLATQAAGVMPNSIAVTQQPMPLFRQPTGVHIPHYPPNYIPYGHYFPPYYVPPPAMHQFLGNHHVFPQQPQPGNVYPPQPAPAAGPTAVKFPLSQYKPASNTGNSMHMGIGGGYGPYGASPVGYSHVSASTAGNSTANEDHAASHFKESNLYITGQQSEGSTVWIPAPGRDIANLPANSFYNLPPQGQHVTFAPTQAGQGTFAGIYHPAQAVTAASVHPFLQQSQAMPGVVDMAGATANVYQQSQHAQMNWPNNY